MLKFQLVSSGGRNNFLFSNRFVHHVILEPEYLDSKEPQVPTYEPLNLQIKSYDYTILENFSSFIHKTAENMDIEVEDVWAVPCQKLSVQTFKPSSTLVENQYNLSVYERNVQVVDLEATIAPVFFHIIQAALPEGVRMTVKLHESADEEVRYVPDQELKQLKTELESIGGPTQQSSAWKKK
nr:EOG090X0MUO [Ilyocryptus agilis]